MSMQIFLLDTNVISQMSRRQRDPVVTDWILRQPRVAIPFPAILEIERGIVEVMPTNPARAAELREWLDGLLETNFIYPEVNAAVAKALARLYCYPNLKNLWIAHPGYKTRKPGQDLFIAAISIAHGLPIATINSEDFDLIDRYEKLPGVFDPSTLRWVVQPNNHACEIRDGNSPEIRRKDQAAETNAPVAIM